MRVAVLGAGAIGAYVGAALHRGGTEVHLVARGPHLEAIRKNGVQVLSPRGDWLASTPATDDPAEIGPVDFVFLGLKANSYASCGPLIEPLLEVLEMSKSRRNGTSVLMISTAIGTAITSAKTVDRSAKSRVFSTT